MTLCTFSSASANGFSLLQKNMEWSDWHTTVLQERNTLENVYRWACGYAFAFSD